MASSGWAAAQASYIFSQVCKLVSIDSLLIIGLWGKLEENSTI
jgi:hypothetical protein